LDLGVDQVEIDVHLTRDGKLIVMHDERVDRTTDGRGYVRDLTLAEMRKLDAGKGERVPTLQEVIDVVRGRATLQIELKGLGVERETVSTVEANRIVDEVVLTSFRHGAVKRAKELNHRLQTGVLFYCHPVRVCQLALDAGADAIHPNVDFVDRAMVDEAHSLGLLVRAWNSDDEDQMRRLVGLGVDAIGSNRPDLLMKVVRESRLA
jgi:glycerophosphoryl diester phosphodiesterase